jgi:hypothetical protein
MAWMWIIRRRNEQEVGTKVVREAWRMQPLDRTTEHLKKR